MQIHSWTGLVFLSGGCGFETDGLECKDLLPANPFGKRTFRGTNGAWRSPLSTSAGNSP